MRTLIVAGGELSPAFLDSYMQTHSFEFLIAADRGLDALLAAGSRLPCLVLGDFDSTAIRDPERFRELGAEVEMYPAEKDFSDLESALLIAMRRGSTDITILGATGGRLDHFLANVMDLRIPLGKGVPARIVDEQNVIYLRDTSFTLRREELYGKYVSLLPLAGCAEHVSLTGFKYSGEDLTLMQDRASFGISNEVTAETAEVRFEGSVLIVVESRDKPCYN